MLTPEGWEKKDIDAYLEKHPVYFIKPATFGMGASGTADRVCCWRGLFFVVEVKREGKEPTPLQELRMNEVRAAGGVAFWGTAAKVIPELEAWFTHGILPRPYERRARVSRRSRGAAKGNS